MLDKAERVCYTDGMKHPLEANLHKQSGKFAFWYHTRYAEHTKTQAEQVSAKIEIKEAA